MGSAPGSDVEALKRRRAFGLAGNAAFRALLAFFPFLIFTSSLTVFIGGRSTADDLIAFLIAIAPPALVDPIVSEYQLNYVAPPLAQFSGCSQHLA